MTTTDIDVTKPSRELDALVAESVMDWEPIPDASGLSIDRDCWKWNLLNGAVYTYHESNLPGLPMYLFSNDIAAAWLVVEKMLELGFRYVIDGHDEEMVVHFISMVEVQHGTAYASPDKPAHAITVAALRAKQVIE